MELTRSFVDLLQLFVPVFTSPTHLTFVAVVTGWVLSHRRRYITDVIFSSALSQIRIRVGQSLGKADDAGDKEVSHEQEVCRSAD